MSSRDLTPDAPDPVASEGVPGVEIASAPPSPTMEKAVAAVVLLFGAAMFAGARSIVVRNETGGIDPRWWPSAIAIGILASGAWMMFNAVTRRRGERDVDPVGASGLIQMVVTAVMTAVILVLWQVGLSFLVLAPAYLIVLNWMYGLRTWKSLLLFPAAITLILYLVFQLLLKVPL
ncbi:tripartite tricarboxylate transporter TctB family protein [Mariniluteicoccus flavus]